jgi:hypothetical protein
LTAPNAGRHSDVNLEVTASLDVDTVLRRVAEAANELCAGDADRDRCGGGEPALGRAAGLFESR